MPQFNSSTIGSYIGKWVIATAVFELLMAGLFFALGAAIPEVRFGFFLTAAILAALAAGLVVVGMRSRARAGRTQRVISAGTPGVATITGLTQTGLFVNENPQVELQLQVQVPGHPPYPVTRKEIVPLILLGRLNNGQPLAVKVDPADPNDVIVDWEAPAPAPDATQGWWGTPAAAATTSSGSPSTETLQEVQATLGASGLQAPPAFSTAEQGGYTVEQVRAYLRANGLSGTATIDRLEDSGKEVGGDHLFTIQATVNVPGHPPHQGPASAALVPKDKVGRVYVGATLPVKVAADNFDAQMVEWDKV
jgi:hypothetical protein